MPPWSLFLLWCCDQTGQLSSLTLQKSYHKHTHTLTYTHTPVAASPGWVSSLAQILCCEILLISFSLFLVASHICQLAWQPAGPHASRGATFALLFVSQNNIRSPIVFPVPHLFSPAVLWTLFAGSERLKHLTQWLLVSKKGTQSPV